MNSLTDRHWGRRYWGRASGVLSVNLASAAAVAVDVVSESERTAHGAVPPAKISANSASPSAEDELKPVCVGGATAIVYARLRAIADGRAAGLLDAALRGATPTVIAADLIRYFVVAKGKQPAGAGAALDDKLNLPAMQALGLMLAVAK